MKRIINFIKRTELDSITENIVDKFMHQKVLIETDNFSSIGVLNKFKGNYAVFVNDIPKVFKLEEVNKLSGKNNKTNLFETIVKCGSGGNGWCVKSEKTHKNLGGPYKSKTQAVHRLKQVEYFKHVKEDTDLLLKEKLLHKFFKMNEEVVNADNVGKLKPQKSNPRAKARDKFAKSSKNTAVPVTGPPGRMDTPKEAKYRFATYLELRNDSSKPKKEKKAKKTKKAKQ